MKNAILAVDIGSGSIKMLYGNKKKVLDYQMVDTPKDSMEDNKVTNVTMISEQIRSFIKTNRLSPKYISFSIYGQDLIIRHIEVPYMKEADVRQAVEWEIGQNIHDKGANYYIEFDILNKKEGKKENVYQILAVAVLKEKIETYIELAKMLDLEIKAIDISANCIARVFKHKTVGKKAKKNIGIIDIGQTSTAITIVENGRLAIERQVPFGVDKIINEINKTDIELLTKEYDYMSNQFHFNDENSELNLRISRFLDTLFSSFQKVIQFYTTGKIEKEISEIFIIGVGSNIKGIETIVHNYLLGPTVIAKDAATIGRKVILPTGCELKYFINSLGLLLRED